MLILNYNEDIALRCYNKPKLNKKKVSESKYNQYLINQFPKRVLCFDTESTIDQSQNLKFGYYELYFHGKLESYGLFYNPEIKKNELKILQDYSRNNNIKLLTLQEFIEDVFYPEIHVLNTICIGFNLPFDISRLAKSFNSARREHNAFTFKLSDRKENPDIIIKHLNKNQAFIYFNTTFQKGIGNSRHEEGSLNFFKGHFLDLKTLTFALTNESHSLESVGKLFNAKIKKNYF